MSEYRIALRNSGISVYVVAGESVPHAIDSIERLAAAIGLPAEGKKLADGLRRDVRGIRPAEPAIPVLFPVWEDPVVLPGGSTFVSDLLRHAGLYSVGEKLGKGWPRAGFAFLRESGARAVILATEPFPYSDADLGRWSSMDFVPATARERVFLVDGALTNRPGPRLAEGLAALARIAESIGGRAERAMK